MAKTSMIERETKRKLLWEKYKERRDTLRDIMKSADAPFEEKLKALVKLQKLPRDSSRCRQRNRCAITGRPRGVYRIFGLGRNKIRELAMRGEIPGLVKSSW